MYILVSNLLLVLWVLLSFSQQSANSRFRIETLNRVYPDFKLYLWPSILTGVLSDSWRSEFLLQSLLWRSQVWDFRRFLFSSAQGLLSFFWIFVCFSIFYQISSYIFILLSMALLVIAASVKRASFGGLQRFGTSFLFFSLVLFFLEISFRGSPFLIQFLMDSELVFFTTIDSVGNLLTLLIVSTVVGLFVPIQGWSLVITFMFFLNSQLSYLGFVFIMAGEFFSAVLFWFYKSRGWHSYYKKKTTGLFVSILAYLFLFLVGIYLLRQVISFGNIYNQLFVLKSIYLTTVFVFLGGLYLTIMVYGHFKATKQDREVAVSDIGLVNDLVSGSSNSVMIFIKSQLLIRREKLIQFKLELEKDPQSKGKIPPFVLNQFETEIGLIDKINSRA